MAMFRTTRTVFTVGQFLNWQRSKALTLQPMFQRREVWSKKSKSMLVDTVVRGLPMPLVFLRQCQDLDTLETRYEVVDGQQRLRTLLAFIDPNCIENLDPDRDEFVVQKTHNKSIAGVRFQKLAKDIKAAILEYEISTHVFPPSTSDEIVLRVFARMNSTGLKLSHQEIRNAEFAGEFKTISYDLAFEHLDFWRRWNVFRNDDFARMVEVETTSDLLIAMQEGIVGKSQPRLTRAYKEFDDSLPGADHLRRRFEVVMSMIDRRIGELLPQTRLRRPALFYSLFTACYDHIFGLKSKLRKSTARRLPTDLGTKLSRLNSDIQDAKLPENVADAMEKATADVGRRRTRHRYFVKRLGLESR